MRKNFWLGSAVVLVLWLAAVTVAPAPTSAGCWDGVWSGGCMVCAAGPPTDCSHCIVR